MILQLQNISVDYVTPHVVKISLDRERQANSLSLALLEELQNILTQINEESNTRVVILTGAGEKVFCAGADLKERAGMNEEQVRHAVSMIRTTMEMVDRYVHLVDDDLIEAHKAHGPVDNLLNQR